MDKIMSARVDEALVQRINMLSKKLNMTKKAIIENAVQHYAAKIESEQHIDILEHTLGSWRRNEPAVETVENIKQQTRRSLERYKR